MKKGESFLLSLPVLSIFLSFLFSINLVSAQTTGLFDMASEGINSFVKFSQGILMPLLGETGTGDVFMGKVLILIILLSITYVILKQALATYFSDHKGLLFLICLAVGILGTRFLNKELVQTIILPNSVLAVAITAGLPFVLYFLIVNRFPTGITRKIAWVFFAVIFLAIYTLRASELGDIAYIYPLTALLSLAMAFLDGTIQRFMINNKIQRMAGSYKRGAAMGIQKTINKAQETFETNPAAYPGGVYSTKSATGSVGLDPYRADMDYLEAELAKLLS